MGHALHRCVAARLSVSRTDGARHVAKFWPLALARELDDAILNIRLNELEVAAIVFKSSGEPAQVLAYDHFLDANKNHWLAREIRHLWKRARS